MPLSYNMAPGGLHYAPARDYAYNYPQMIQSIIRAFNKDYWPDMLKTLAEARTDCTAEDFEPLWEDVCKAKDCFCEFINIICQDPEENVEQVLERSGFTKLCPAAQIAWMAMMGQVMTGQLFMGIRDITGMGEQHASVLELLQVGHNARRLMNNADVAKERDLAVAALQQAAKAAQDTGMSQTDVRKVINEALADMRLPEGK